jgi:polyhydroxyalkanoate synthesis repressor PhaR
MKNKTPQPLIIKKYENRRLYNTVTSQYINQEQVAHLVRDGHDVRVIDAATGDDITRLVLAQIVLDDAKAPNSIFPLDVLRQMVLASGKATQENALRYMKTMMEMYQDAYRAMPSPLAPFGLMPSLWPQAGAPEARGRDVQDSGAGSSAAEQAHRMPVPHPSGEPKATDVDELRRRLEELETALAQRKAAPKKRKTKSRRKS